MLLSAELRARLERLALQSRRRVKGLWTGRHLSVRRGESLDFADYREYTPGDDFRRIDHQLWARLGVLLVRRFEAEEELPLRIVVDRSASMGLEDKFTVARTLAAMICYLGLAGGDRVRPVATPGPGGEPIGLGPPGRHLGAWPQLERWLEQLTPAGEGRVADAARVLASDQSVRGDFVVVSDLLEEGWAAAIDGIGSAGGGLLLQVLGPNELEPDLAGDLALVDVETGASLPVSTSAATLARYRESLVTYLDEVARRSRRAGLDHLVVPAVEGAPERTLAALASQGLAR